MESGRVETLRLHLRMCTQDSDVLKEASEMVDEVLEADPALCTPENRILKKKMDEFAKEQLKEDESVMSLNG